MCLKWHHKTEPIFTYGLAYIYKIPKKDQLRLCVREREREKIKFAISNFIVFIQISKNIKSQAKDKENSKHVMRIFFARSKKFLPDEPFLAVKVVKHNVVKAIKFTFINKIISHNMHSFSYPFPLNLLFPVTNFIILIRNLITKKKEKKNIACR